MNASRRRFLQTTFGSATLVSAGLSVPRFLARTALAADAAKSADNRVLVVVQLTGGNDGLNTVAPCADDKYAAARKTLRVTAEQALKIDDYVGFHPRMTGYSKLLEAGRLAIVQGVGYPNPDRSHFRSMDIWHAAQPAVKEPEDGWLGRSLGKLSHAAGDIPGLHLGREKLPLALLSRKATAPSMESVAGFKLRGDNGALPLAALKEFAELDRAATPGPLDFVRQTTLAAYTSSAKLQATNRGESTAATYPRQYELARKLEQVAHLIDAGLGTSIYYVTLDGFDTHSAQGAAHASLLAELSASTQAFLDDVEARGQGERVVVMTFSEFGRRVEENGSAGTDHGAAAPLFLAGAVKPGLAGKHPSLTDLDQGDLKYSIDFRRVYATLLDNWLALDSQEILGEKFDALDVLRA